MSEADAFEPPLSAAPTATPAANDWRPAVDILPIADVRWQSRVRQASLRRSRAYFRKALRAFIRAIAAPVAPSRNPLRSK